MVERRRRVEDKVMAVLDIKMLVKLKSLYELIYVHPYARHYFKALYLVCIHNIRVFKLAKLQV